MDILRWLANVLRCVAGRTVEPEAPRERRLLGYHEGVALHVVKDTPSEGDVAITASLDWVFSWTHKLGTRRVRAWITTRDTTRGCGCGCGHSCEGEQTGEMTVVLDYPYNNGGGVVRSNITDFAIAMQVARSAAEGDIDKVLAENREELAKKQRINSSQAELRKGIEQLFGEPTTAARPERSPAVDESSELESAEGEDWSMLFGEPGGNDSEVPARVAETDVDAASGR